MRRPPARTGRGRSSGGKKKQAAKKPAVPVKPSKRQSEAAKQYATRRKLVARVVDFSIPAEPSPAATRKLNRYYKYVFGVGADHTGGESGVAIGYGKVAVKRKDPAKLAKLQKRYGQGRLPGVKFVWIPSFIDPLTDKPVRPVIRHRVNEPDVIIFPYERTDPDTGEVIAAGSITTQYLDFDKGAMLRDMPGEVTRVAGELAELMGVDVDKANFRIRNGENQMMDVRRLAGTIAMTSSLMAAYGNWNKWLDGMMIVQAEDQETLTDFNRTMRREFTRRRRIRSINLEQAVLLRAIEKTRGGAMTEVLSQMVTGSLHDVEKVRTTLEHMRKMKRVTGGDSRWMLTRTGQTYLNSARAVLPLFGL